jgi:hypothetical protein
MACLNKKSDIGVHKANFHGDVFAIRKNCAPVCAALLYEAKYVVPPATRAMSSNVVVDSVVSMMNSPATIQPRGMVSQLEKYLFHLESGRKSFNQNSSPDSIVRQADVRLSEKENVVPQTGLEIVLHLWKVKVRAKAPLNEFLGIVIEVKAKIE